MRQGILTAAALAVGLSATSPALANDFDFSLLLPDLPEYGNQGSFERIIFLDFEATQRNSAAMLRDGRVVIAYDPSYKDHFGHLGMTGVTDIGLVKRLDAPMSREALVVAKPGAPAIINIYSPNDDPLTPFFINEFDDPALVDSKLVRCTDVDADGFLDFFFVVADGRSIYCVSQEPGGWTTPLLVHYAIRQIEQLEIGEFDNIPGPDLAILTELTLDILSTSGDLLRRETSTIDPSRDLLHVVRDVSPGQDQVAFVKVTDASGEQSLVTFDTTQGQNTTVLTDLDVVAISSGLFGGDSAPDIIAALAGGSLTVILHNQTPGGTLEFSLLPNDRTDLISGPDNTPPVGSRPALACLDADRNEGTDIVYCSNFDGSMNFTSDYFAGGHTVRMGGSGSGVDWGMPVDFTYGDYTFNGGTTNERGGYLSAWLNVPTQSQGGQTATHFEVVSWVKDDHDDLYTDYTAYSKCEMPILGGPPPTQLSGVYVPLPEPPTPPTGELDWSRQATALEVRALKKVGQQVVWAGPSVVLYFACNPTAFDFPRVDNKGAGEGPFIPITLIAPVDGDRGTGFFSELFRTPRHGVGGFPNEDVPCAQPDAD